MSTFLSQVVAATTQTNKSESNPLKFTSGLTLAATVEKDLGGGNYQMRAGDMSLTVQSKAGFTENQQVNLRVVSATPNKLSFEVAPPATGANAQTGNSDAAVILKGISFSVPTSEITANAQELSTPSLEVNATPEGDNNKVQLELPSGTKIEAEASQTEKAPAQTTEATTQTSNTDAAGQVKANTEAVLQEKTATSQTQSKADDISQDNAGKLSKFLSEIARRVLSEDGGTNPSPITDKTSAILRNFLLPTEVNFPSDNTSIQARVQIPPQLLESVIQALAAAPENISLDFSDPLMPLVKFNGSELPIQLATLPIFPEGEQTPPAEIKLQPALPTILESFVRQNVTPDSLLETAAPTTEKIDALLRSSGLTPSLITRQAAQALLEEKLPVARENVQTLLSVTAGTSGAERQALLQATSRLIALDAPVSPAIAAGMAELMSNESSLSDKIATTINTINEAVTSNTESQGNPQITKILNTTAKTLSGIAVLVDTASTANELEDFVSTMGKERMAAAENGIKDAATLLLKSNPELQKIDAALNTVLTKLANLPESSEPVATIDAQATQANIEGSKIDALLEKQTNPSATSLPLESKAEGATPQEQLVANEKHAVQKDLQEIIGKLVQPASNEDQAQINATLSKIAQTLKVQLPALPGASDFPAQFKDVPEQMRIPENADLQKIEQVLKDIQEAKTPEEAKEIAKEAVKHIDRDTLRELAGRLQDTEKEEIAKSPQLQKLSDAAQTLRELGRAFIAQKAENLATLRQDPAMFVANVPLNFSGEEGDDGKLQMYYRKAKKGTDKNWSQRIVLDLNMSMLGNIIGDLQFKEKQLNVTLLSDNADTVFYLQSEAERLEEGLNKAGFSCKPAFKMVETRKPKATVTQEQHPLNNGRLDIKI